MSKIIDSYQGDFTAFHQRYYLNEVNRCSVHFSAFAISSIVPADFIKYAFDETVGEYLLLSLPNLYLSNLSSEKGTEAARLLIEYNIISIIGNEDGVMSFVEESVKLKKSYSLKNKVNKYFIKNKIFINTDGVSLNKEDFEFIKSNCFAFNKEAMNNHEVNNQTIAVIKNYTQKSRFLIIKENDVKVGSVRIDIGINTIPDISLLYVLPEFRNKGYAKRLVAHAVNLLKDEGYPIITIAADAKNPITNDMFVHMGFQLNEQYVEYIFEGHIETKTVKILNHIPFLRFFSRFFA